jgi:hypothetical protein
MKTLERTIKTEGQFFTLQLSGEIEILNSHLAEISLTNHFNIAYFYQAQFLRHWMYDRRSIYEYLTDPNIVPVPICFENDLTKYKGERLALGLTGSHGEIVLTNIKSDPKYALVKTLDQIAMGIIKSIFVIEFEQIIRLQDENRQLIGLHT